MNGTQRLYLDAYESTAGRQPAWLDALRSDAVERFRKAGFPTLRDEDWKYTNTSPIEKAGFAPAGAPGAGVRSRDLDEQAFRGLDALRATLVDGFFVSELAALDELPEGVRVCSLATALVEHAELLRAHLGPLPEGSHGYRALNAAFASDGVFVQVDDGVQLERPLHLMIAASGPGSGQTHQPRNLVLLGAGARATLIEHFVSLADEAYLLNLHTDVHMAEGSRLEHYRLQQHNLKAFHIDGLDVRLAADAVYTGHAVDLGGRLVRHELKASLDAPGAEAHLNGLYLTSGRQHVDHFTHVDHNAPGAVSREFYKGILDGRSRAVFHGRIVVHPDAQKTDSAQENKNLLLSRDAEVDTKPQLEIYADDVKCSHGATVGQIDMDSLFYLRSRGIDEKMARDLLTWAFANDVLARIGLRPIRDALERILGAALLHGHASTEVEPGQ
ncbi:MAG: Fe-S cluster assembly protein SufD [Gammaproteobacteria bacterium]|nr:Fe-S cluster assembly protein SufD [Gammaproteobacteria bacterium]